MQGEAGDYFWGPFVNFKAELVEAMTSAVTLEAPASVYMEMSIAVDWGKERLLRWTPLLHGCWSLAGQEGTRKSTRLHPGDGRKVVYMVMELALLWFFCGGYICM